MGEGRRDREGKSGCHQLTGWKSAVSYHIIEDRQHELYDGI